MKSLALREALFAVLLLLAVLFGSSIVHATTYNWTQTAGGSQAWTTDANWSGGTAPNPASGDTVDFSTVNILAHTTLSLGADRTAEVWKFGDTSDGQDWIVASGNTITLAGTTPTINVVNRTTTLNCVLDGTAGLTKDGAAELVLGNTANIYSGDTVINAGTLRVSSDSNLGEASGSITLNGGRLRAGGNITIARDITIEAAGGWFYTAGGVNFVTTGTLTGSGTLTHTYVGSAGQRSLAFMAANNDFTGAIMLLEFAATVTVNSLADSGNRIVFNNSGSAPKFALGSGDASPLLFNSRQIELASASTYGATVNNNNANANATVTINTDLLITGEGDKTLTLGGSNTGNNTFAGAITNGAGAVISLTKEGNNGRWILSNTNTYTGATTVSAGTLQVTKLANGGAASSIGQSDNSATNLVFGHNAVLRYSGSGDSTDRRFTQGANVNNANLTIDASGTGAISFTNTDPITHTQAGASQARGYILTGTSTGNNTLATTLANNSANVASFTKTGIGTWVLSGSNTFTGASSISGGGTLVLDYSSQDYSKLSDTAALNLGSDTLGGGTLVLKGGIHTEVVLSTTLRAGTFITRPDGDSGTSVLQMNAITRPVGASISFLDGTVATTDNVNNNGILGGWATIGNDWAINSTGGADGAITALVSYTGTLPSSGTGANTANYTLEGGQAQTGTATLLANSIKITGTGATDNTLDLAGTRINITGGSETIASGGVLYVGGGTGLYNITADADKGISVGTTSRDLIITTVTGTLNISARINQAFAGLSLVKAGAGTLVLSSTENVYNAIVYVNGGALRLASNAAAGTTAGGIRVQNGAALELVGDIAVGAEALTITGTGISNGGALQNVSGDNTYGGAVTIGLGGARINSASGTLTLSGGVVTAVDRDLTVGGAGNVTVSSAISEAGTLTKDGEGTLTLSGANTYTGTTSINAGTLALGADNALDTDNNIVFAGGTLSVGSYSNELGTLTVTGASTIALGDGSGSLTFANGSGVTWTHNLALTGTLGATTLRFGTNASGLTEAQLARITVSGSNVRIDSNGYLIKLSSGTIFLFE